MEGSDLTAAQLYSTASYKQHDLTGLSPLWLHRWGGFQLGRILPKHNSTRGI